MDAAALHSAARKFLLERYADLHRQYAAVPETRDALGRYAYSPEALAIFPRYHVAEAVRIEVERLDADRLPDVATLADALRHAADSAQTMFTEGLDHPIEGEATAAERRLFREWVDAWLAAPADDPEPLAYRRVLTDDESAEWWARVDSTWGTEGRSWHPLLAAPVPDGVLVLRHEAMWDGGGCDAVRAALSGLGRHRVVELREHGPEYVVALDLLHPVYDGAEGVWTDDALDWVAYASHEGTVAFGGSLATALPAHWPDIAEWRWTGW